MTRKRYIKLVYALMTKFNEGNKIASMGTLLKGVQKLEFKNMDQTKLHSYSEAWESLKTIRNQYGM